MIQMTRWQADVEPGSPWDRSIVATEHYAGLPGGYATFYKQRLDNVTGLAGLGSLGAVSVGGTVLAGVVGLGLGLAAGYFGGGALIRYFRRR